MRPADSAVLERMSEAERQMLREALQRVVQQNRLARYRPYAKQSEFHALGAKKRERMLSAGNQLGKTLSAGAEVAMHLTGRYPAVWAGKRFTKGNHWLAGSETGDLTRKGVQRILFGREPWLEPGTGMVPGDAILGVKRNRHSTDLIDTARVRFTDAEGKTSVSTISLKSYDQGRERWQADTVDGVWFDEEPPEDIYMEGLTRTNVAFGPVIVTCTLLQGMTKIASRFWLELAKYPDAAMVNMTIDDVDHYDPATKAAIIAGYPPHERDARTKGIPMLGSGRIFPVDEELIKVPAFSVPAHWPQIAGIDFGWDHPSAATRLAWDRDADIVYVTAAHRQKEQTPLLFAATVKPWGDWLPWAWPPDGLQTEKGSGKALAPQYRAHGLNLLEHWATNPPADGQEEGKGGTSVEAGLMDMLDRMQTGRWKVFDHLNDWFEEFRMYHRKDGKIVKLQDDLMSSSRYGNMMLRHAIVKPRPPTRATSPNYGRRRGGY